MVKVYKKLLAIQSELKAPKTQYNNFGKYKYRNCEDILEALKPILAKNLAVVTVSDEVVPAGERFYIKATAKITDAESGESVETTAFAREEYSKKGMDGSQLTGSSSSYARKYALNGLFAIDDTKDADFQTEDSTDHKKSLADYYKKVFADYYKRELKETLANYCKKANTNPAEVKLMLTNELKVDFNKLDAEIIKKMVVFLKEKMKEVA